MSVLIPLVLVGILCLLALAVEVCLGVWTYRDAKSRGLEAGVWTAVVVLVPSFVGLLLYLLVGRHRVADAPLWAFCPSCGAKTEAGRPYCSSCGSGLAAEDGGAASDVPGVAPEPVRPAPVSRAPIVAAIVCVAVGLLLVGLIAVLNVFPYMSSSTSTAVMQLETSSQTSWRFTAAYFDGSEARAIMVRDGGSDLSVSSSVGEGAAELAVLVDGEECESFELGTDSTPDVVDLSPYAEDGWITLEIRADRARDVSVDLSW